ncbi:hypothetical protein E2320_013211 [Naja naja]|nr:hypothetical protein E2320_013211 [Naja naja]
MAAAGQPSGEQPPRPRSAAPLLAREEEYRRLNAALEAEAAAVMRQAEELMRGRREALARPVSARENALEAAAAAAAKERDFSSPEPPVPVAQNKVPEQSFHWVVPLWGEAEGFLGQPYLGSFSYSELSGQQTAPSATEAEPGPQRFPSHPCSSSYYFQLSSTKSRLQVDSSNTDVAAPGCSLTKLIGRIEGQLEEGNLPDLEDNLIPSTGCELGAGEFYISWIVIWSCCQIAEAQIRFLKAKLRVMQEELDAIGQECSKKDEENENFSSRLKEVEEERGRLQRAASLQQSQAEKYKLLSEEATRKNECLQQKLSMLEKELENLKRAQKQAAATQSTTDIRLNRALEEAEKYKMELNKLKQSNKDVVNQEHKKLEELKIENKRLEKQKEELVAGFKKQLKLIDILKRQKASYPMLLVTLIELKLRMHIESAKMLSFTEEEFMKALDWGNP